MSLLFQAILMAFLAWMCKTGAPMWSKWSLGMGAPLVAGLLNGIIMGNISYGLEMGGTIMLVYIGVTVIGGTVASDVTLGGYIGVTASMLARRGSIRRNHGCGYPGRTRFPDFSGGENSEYHLGGKGKKVRGSRQLKGRRLHEHHCSASLGFSDLLYSGLYYHLLRFLCPGQHPGSDPDADFHRSLLCRPYPAGSRTWYADEPAV